MTIEKLEKMVSDGVLYMHHSATRQGYISRKTRGYIKPYEGRFGRGYAHYTPRWDTSRYIGVTYYIYSQEGKQ